MTGTTAIVAEGGGQRGIYTAGVLDAFMDRSFNPFDLSVGVSAGAQNLLAYALRQPGYGRRAIEELTSRPEFLLRRRFLSSRSMLDLDGYFETTLHDPDYQLPYHRLDTETGRQRFVVVATNRHDMEAVYLEPDSATALNHVKASCAVPFLYRSGVTVSDRVLLDGGVADPLPVRYAYEQGARRILLVRTAPLSSQREFDNAWCRLLMRTKRLPIKPGRLLRLLEHHEQAMQATLDFVLDPPDDLTLHVIAPQRALKSRVFSSPAEHLVEDYQRGFDDGTQAMGQLEPWSVSRAALAV